jgi:hypothetical protein
MIRERQFRADLFYRISVFPIAVPALRNRPEDIPLLVRHFAMNYAKRMHKPITAISEDFIAALARHSWPGNVRELQNLIERSVILSTGSVLNGSLPELTCTTQDGSKCPEVSAPVTLEEAARSHILQTLLRTEGVVGGQNGAAARLGLPRTTLVSKMRRMGINPGQNSSAPVRAAAPMAEVDARSGGGAGNRWTCEYRATESGDGRSLQSWLLGGPRVTSGDRRRGTDVPERQTTATLEPPPDPSSVNKDRAQGWGSDDAKVDASGAITPYQCSDPRETISTIGWLSASILHDLRNPLGTMCAGTELLMDLDSTSSQVKRLAVNIYRAAGRIRQLLADLASVARANISTPELCDIREIVTGASEAALAAMTEQRSVEILLDVPDGIDVPLMRSHIERVFFNLIANAFEAMPGGGTVRIGARKAGTSVLVEFEDTGPGIPACISDRLFEPLVTSGKQDGLGLGLALARQTVRNHGGDMWTEPAPGARFVIRLPLDRTNCVLGPAASSRNVSTAT